MKEWFRKLRHKIAYLIAPDWIDDLEERLSELLCYATGSRLSNPYYTLGTMETAVDDHLQSCCDECEHYLKCQKEANGGKSD